MRVLKKDLWPHCVRLKTNPGDAGRDVAMDIELWLGDKLGCFRDRWNCVYHCNGTDYYFRKGEDATLFALRWS